MILTNIEDVVQVVTGQFQQGSQGQHSNYGHLVAVLAKTVAVEVDHLDQQVHGYFLVMFKFVLEKLGVFVLAVLTVALQNKLLLVNLDVHILKVVDFVLLLVDQCLVTVVGMVI